MSGPTWSLLTKQDALLKKFKDEKESTVRMWEAAVSSAKFAQAVSLNLLVQCRAVVDAHDDGDAPETFKTGWAGGRVEFARQLLGYLDKTTPETKG